jgi:hypothetical protein
MGPILCGETELAEASEAVLEGPDVGDLAVAEPEEGSSGSDAYTGQVTGLEGAEDPA